ncbi:hypothetical protein LOK74_00095 [Brevibacillus humidisoli]|uniref:hypothetical protein n=1 Tax=Brevibacillus humidisoli TaxID=2895522 RepID=UPI001E429A1D|nr:hypothetical protein [Brevibacillus humidisoli]UFJ41003.1 hypothetical protein LOK74_00095 [Brevibacillus humidisoli]
MSVNPLSVNAHDPGCYGGYDCHTWEGRFSSANDLKVWNHSSVSDTGWTDFVDEAIDDWNDITPDVELSEVSSKSDSDIRVYAGTYTWDMDGLQEPYYNSENKQGIDEEAEETWALANVRLNRRTLEYSEDKSIQQTTTHEFGHCLSLGHVLDDGNGYYLASVINTCKFYYLSKTLIKSI